MIYLYLLIKILIIIINNIKCIVAIVTIYNAKHIFN